jgi:hypothetical protein
MKSLNWVDYVHYGSGLFLLALAALAQMGVHLPGVEINPAVAGASGFGILVAGLKSGWASKSN